MTHAKTLISMAGFLIVSLAATTGAFAQDVTQAQAENAGLRTVVNAQKSASPELPNVPLLTDGQKADVKLLKDEYATVDRLTDAPFANVPRLYASTE